jgi:predicted lipase
VLLYTYGQPRFGNKNLANYLMRLFSDGEYYRVVYSSDLVPHVPTTKLGYMHAGHEVWYPKDNHQYIICDNYENEPENIGCS